MLSKIYYIQNYDLDGIWAKLGHSHVEKFFSKICLGFESLNPRIVESFQNHFRIVKVCSKIY